MYGLSLYIDVHGDPESWNCVGNLGILGLGWGVVASFHALRKVVKAGDGALAKLKVINSSSLQGGRGAVAGRSQLRLLSVRSTQVECSLGYASCDRKIAFVAYLIQNKLLYPDSDDFSDRAYVLYLCAGGCAAKPEAMADGVFSVVRDFLRHRGGAARPGSLHVLPAHGTSSRFPWGLGHRRSRHGSIGVVPVS